MSWGRGIALTLAVFIGGMIYLVYKSAQQKFSLVNDQYYEVSLQYDDVQLRNSNYAALREEAEVHLNREHQLLSVSLPSVFNDLPVSGKVHFYCPSDARADRIFELEQPFVTSVKDMRSGMWKVQVEWESGGEPYRFERTVILAP